MAEQQFGAETGAVHLFLGEVCRHPVQQFLNGPDFHSDSLGRPLNADCRFFAGYYIF